MKNNDAFYYEETTSDVTYTRTPTGNLNIKHLIEGKPCWISPVQPRAKKKKTLILADWTAQQWPEEKRIAIEKAFNNLIEQGFSLYCWQNNQVVPLTQAKLHNLHDQDFLETIHPASIKTITNTATHQHKLTYDQIRVLDYHWVHELLHDNDELGPRLLRSSELSANILNQSKALFSTILTTEDRLDCMVLDRLSQPSLDAAQAMASIIPDLKITHNIVFIDLDAEGQVFDLFDGRKDEIRYNIGSRTIVFNKRDLQSVEELDVSNTGICGDNLTKLLKAMPNLKRINLSRCKNITESLEISPDSLLLLEEISLNSCDISNASLSSFLKAAPNLKKIDLSFCKDIITMYDIFPNSLSSLEEIHLLFTAISNASLIHLFQAAPNLKRIKLDQNSKIHELLELSPNLFISLDEINLFSISNISLTQLLNAAPNLKKIYLYGCNVDDDISEFLPNSLKSLEEIYLDLSFISSANLTKLLSAAPNLKKIYLSHCENIDELLKLLPNSLYSLEEINLRSSMISSANLTQLLNTAPNLKKIYLYDCNLDDGLLELLPNNLKSLEEIHLDISSTSSASLTQLLSTAPNLKKIYLHGFNIDDDISELLPNSLKSLEEIHLDLSFISSANLTKLLSAAPNLKKIYLSHCENIDELLKFLPNSLCSLEEIHIKHSSISSASLTQLLNAAPNLKRIDLPDCKNIHDVLVLLPNSLNSLEEINLRFSMISSASLTQLFMAAPNLKKLDLSRCKKIGHTFNISLNSLNSIEEIDLKFSSISSAGLTELFRAAPNIKKLDLSQCHNISNTFNISPNSLSSLKDINVNYTTISSVSLAQLLKAAPNLKKINLSECENINEAFEILPDSLIYLEEIKLKRSTISSANLAQLLKAAPNLKKINLSECENISEVIELLPDSLIYLEEIKLNRSTISNANLTQLIKAAPNIKAIDISDCENISETLPKIQQMIENPQPKKTPSTYIDYNPKQDPKHNPKKNKDRKPTPSDYKFEFKGNNKTQNQGMIIEKLSQYLTLQQKYIQLIPEIQDGICVPLSIYFSETTEEAWKTMMTDISAWDGQSTVSPALQSHFDNILSYIETYQYNQESSIYLGDNVESFLPKLVPPHHTCLFSNPWHTMAVKYDSNNKNYLVYDPNYVGGYRRVRKEELLKTLKDTLGSLISVNAKSAPIKCAINNPDQFLEYGGLLALVQCKNKDAMLTALNGTTHYSDAALEGLLLRDTFGRPAWLLGIQQQHPNVTAKLKTWLTQFINKPDAGAQLLKSLDALTPEKIKEGMNLLYQWFPLLSTQQNKQNKQNKQTQKTQKNQQNKPTQSPEQRAEDLAEDSEIKKYEDLLATWQKTTPPTQNIKKYCMDCLQRDNNQLIELESTQNLDALRIHLETISANLGKPAFYIDKPDDLICSAPWMKKNADQVTGKLQPGPGGPLYDFLTQHRDKAPILIVNYEAFNADDIVKFNALLDKEPRVDGTTLPPKTKIVGLINRNKPDCYQGEDFYSRFHTTEHCPRIQTNILPKVATTTTTTTRTTTATATATATAISTKSDVTVIQLYHAANWEERLLGYWELDGNRLYFKEGALIDAINAGKPIQIQQGPWEDESFVRFWQRVMSTGIRQTDRTVLVPQALQVTRPAEESYNWSHRLSKVNFLNEHSNTVDVQVLNPTCLNDFFSRYELHGKQLMKRPGWLQEAKHRGLSTLNVHVTGTLNEHQWARLLDECEHMKITLNITCSPGVTLPHAWHHQPSHDINNRIKNDIVEYTFEKKTRDYLIISNDIDTSLATIVTQNQTAKDSPVVINISECTAADLFLRLDGTLHETTNKFEFIQTEGAVITALKQGKTVILNGQFSPELQDSLASLLQTRKDRASPGRLILIADDPKCAPYITPRYRHHVSPADKKNHLLKKFSAATVNQLDPIIFEKESLSQLHARCRFLKRNPTGNSQDAFKGLLSLDRIEWNKTNQTQNTAQEDIQALRDQVNTVLQDDPCIILTGPSGSGKSTFVEKDFCQKGDRLYLSEKRIKEWAKDTSNQRKILCIDEANFGTWQWSEFEGLFNTPPTILIDGELYTLTNLHKVVFIINPLNYEGERQLPPFFQRHGNTLVFTPLSRAVIREKILKPVFEGIEDEDDYEIMIEQILNVYDFICSCSTTDVLISPRELQMMALLCMRQSGQAPIQVAQHYAYELGKNLVPPQWKKKFDEQFKPASPVILDTKKLNIQASNFLITPSREAIFQQLNELLNLREWRQTEAHTLNEQQKFGGTGGFIIEGEPGIGKSELVMHALRERGYREIDIHSSQTSSDSNIFYRMPVSMGLEEKKALLIKAFNEGAVVVIDELNSSPMMERLLNDLLMGKNPYAKKGDPPPKPGFMIICTQNSTKMAGRRPMSTAQLHRCIINLLPDYPMQELKQILLKKGIHHKKANAVLKAYEKQRTYATRHHLNPAPNFRNLMQLVDDHWRARNSLKKHPAVAKHHSQSSYAKFFSNKELTNLAKEIKEITQNAKRIR